MVNEPLPHQLTIGVLRDVIAECDERAVVGLVLNRADLVEVAADLSRIGDIEMEVYMNVRVARTGGSVVQLRLSRQT
jgi:hypothetical protein